MRYHCERCQYDWESKLPEGQKPKQCPKCKAPEWWRAPKKGKRAVRKVDDGQTSGN